MTHTDTRPTRPSRPVRRRRRIVAAGLVSFVLLAVAATRSSSDRSPSPPDETSDTTTVSGSAEIGPSGGLPPPSLGPIPAAAGSGPGSGAGPGPRTVDGLVPVGYDQSEAGAVMAATTYLAVLQQLLLEDPTVRQGALERIATTGTGTLIAETLAAMAAFDTSIADGQARTGNISPTPAADPGSGVVTSFVREIPVAYQLAQYTPERARIEVWSLAVVLIAGISDLTEVWSTNTVELVWDRDDWRVWSWSRTPGPVPTPSSITPDTPTAILTRIGGWTGYQHVPAH